MHYCIVMHYFSKHYYLAISKLLLIPDFVDIILVRKKRLFIIRGSTLDDFACILLRFYISLYLGYLIFNGVQLYPKIDLFIDILF